MKRVLARLICDYVDNTSLTKLLFIVLMALAICVPLLLLCPSMFKTNNFSFDNQSFRHLQMVWAWERVENWKRHVSGKCSTHRCVKRRGDAGQSRACGRVPNGRRVLSGARNLTGYLLVPSRHLQVKRPVFSFSLCCHFLSVRCNYHRRSVWLFLSVE